MSNRKRVSIQLAYYTLAQWTAWNGVLLSGQVSIVSDAIGDAVRLKIGDGVTTWTALPYYNPASSSQTLQQTLGFGNTTSGYNLIVTTNDEIYFGGLTKFSQGYDGSTLILQDVASSDGIYLDEGGTGLSLKGGGSALDVRADIDVNSAGEIFFTGTFYNFSGLSGNKVTYINNSNHLITTNVVTDNNNLFFPSNYGIDNPTPGQTLNVGANYAGVLNLGRNGGAINLIGAFKSTLSLASLTADRVHTLPNYSCTLASSAIVGYNVLDYGLVGDGVTDDRAALNTLLNTTAPTGSTIYFPQGTYLIGSNISVTDKQFNFVGVQSIIKTTANVSILTISSTVAAASKWKIEGLVFQGNDTGTSQIGLNFSDNSGSFQILNSSFTDFGGSGVYVANNETSDLLGGMILGCKFYSNNIGVNLNTRGEYVQVLGCDFISNTKGIISIAGNSIINACNLNYNGTGIEVDTGANNGHSIISNCNINHNTTYSLNIQNTSVYMTLTGNHIYQGGIRVFTCTGVEFIGGIIDVGTITVNTTTGTKFNHVNFDNAYTNTVTVTGTSPEFFRCSGDVPTTIVNNCGAWVDYSSTSTVVGWSSTSSKVIRYTIVGKTLICEFSINGTSNSASTTFTLPLSNANFTSKARGCYAVNNGTVITNGGVAWVNSNQNTVTIYRDWALTAAWTASGTKQIVGSIEIELA